MCLDKVRKRQGEQWGQIANRPAIQSVREQDHLNSEHLDPILSDINKLVYPSDILFPPWMDYLWLSSIWYTYIIPLNKGNKTITVSYWLPRSFPKIFFLQAVQCVQLCWTDFKLNINCSEHKSWYIIIPYHLSRAYSYLFQQSIRLGIHFKHWCITLSYKSFS